jgi:cyclic pyranopterin phosphate synthase
MSAEGLLYTCLFAVRGLDLRALLRRGMGDGELEAQIRKTWRARSDSYSAERSQLMAAQTGPAAPAADAPAAQRSRSKIEMSYIGG